MTVPNETSYAELAWTGAETTFAPGIRCRATADITVGYLDANGQSVALTVNVHYSISRDSATKVITVVPIALPAAPRTLTFNRRTPATQTVAFTDLSKYTALTHEDLHDIAAFRAAELWHEVVSRTSWSPALAAVADGARIVHQVVDWIGGFGDKPDTGQYIGAAGYVTLIADAVDIRGAPGGGAGSGDFSGPASAAADGNVVLFNGIGGKTGKDGGTFAALFAGALLEDETSVAGANPCAIGAAATARILITGGAGDVSFSNAVKRLRIVRFPVSKTLKHNATSLVLIGAADRVTAAGDQGVYMSDATGNWRELAYQRADGSPTGVLLDANVPTALITPRMLAAAAVAQGVYMLNGTIAKSRTGNAETWALKTLAGTDPTAADPVWLTFPNQTGGYTSVKQTAALSLTASSGSTLGAVNGVPFCVVHTLHYDGAAVHMGAIQCKTSALDILGLDAFGNGDTTAEGGAGAADSAQVFYTDSALVAKDWIIIGRSSYSLAAVGTWGTAPTKTQLAGPSFVLPGRSFGDKYVELTASGSTVSTSFADTGLTFDMTLRDAANVVVGEAVINCTGTSGFTMFQAMRGSTALSVGDAAGSRTRCGAQLVAGGLDALASVTVPFRDAPGSLGPHTYKTQWLVTAGTGRLHFAGSDTNSASFGRSISSMKARQVQA